MTVRSRSWTILTSLIVALHAPAALGQTKIPWDGIDLAGRPCSIVHGQSSFGAYDYTNPEHVRDHLRIVEAFHFTAKVENLVSGEAGTLVGDMQYTLRAFPNHHRALWAMVRHQLRSQRKLEPPPECWLDRGISFRPDDAALHLIYGIYLHRLGKHDLALEKYQRAEALSPEHSELLYNMGLLYLDVGKYSDALAYARKAYALNYPLPGLRERLQQRGYSLSP